MVHGILFTDKRFETRDDDNLLDPLTDNTIILCSNYKIMAALAGEIINTINGKAEYNEYCCDKEDIGKAEYEINFGLQKRININGQIITLCLEPAMIYKAKNIRDIWFFDYVGKDDNYKEFIYPMLIFKSSDKVWERGLDYVYETIISGRYGCYDGKWIKNINDTEN